MSDAGVLRTQSSEFLLDWHGYCGAWTNSSTNEDDRFDEVEDRSAKVYDRFSAVNEQLHEVQAELNEVKVAVARLEGSQQRWIVPR